MTIRCALLTLLLVTACSSGGGETTSEPSRCETVPLEQMQRLAEGAEKDVGKLTFTKAAAVKSKDYASVYMIAGRFTAPGVDEVGVWSSNKLTIGDGLILAVDGIAKQFTVWPDGDRSTADVSVTADGVDAAKDCLS